MTTIQLAQYELELTDRYAEGSVITGAEAKVLNVARSERIRNRVARWLERHAEKNEVLTGEKLAALRAYANEVDSNFEFETRDVTKTKRGTLESEVREIAAERAAARAREIGRPDDEALRAQLMDALLEDEGVEREAAARLEARHRIAIEGLASL